MKLKELNRKSDNFIIGWIDEYADQYELVKREQIPQAETEAVSAELALLCCPFCGGTDVRAVEHPQNEYVWCQTLTCPIYDVEIKRDEWQNRAI